MTKVSVVIPVFNAFRWKDSLIRSLLENIDHIGEVVLVNDGDAGDFDALCAALADATQVVMRVRATTGRQGPGVARNLGLDCACFPYVAFLDCDDRWPAGSVARRLALLEAHPEAPFVYCGYARTFDGETVHNDVMPPAVATYASLCLTNFIATPTVILRMEKVGALRFGAIGHEDFDMWLRVLRVAMAPAVGLQEVQLFVRVTPNSRSSVKTTAAHWHYRILREHGFGPVMSAVLFGMYGINAYLKRWRRHYRPTFLLVNHLVALRLGRG